MAVFALRSRSKKTAAPAAVFFVGKAPASALGKEEKGDGDHGGYHSGQTQQEVEPHVLLRVEATHSPQISIQVSKNRESPPRSRRKTVIYSPPRNRSS